jgi:hypothetical protein
VNVDPRSGVALSWIVEPPFSTREQTPPQEMPAALETSPLPVPPFVTVSRRGMAWNVTVATLVAVTKTVHCISATASHPLQLPTVEPWSGFAVSTTVESAGKRAEHVGPQLIPDGELVTVPVPVPTLTTEAANDERIVKERELEVPPPGGGVRTATRAMPAAATSAAAIEACSLVPLTNVVARFSPFH